MTQDWDRTPRQSDSPRRRASARLGVLAAGVLVASLSWCQLSSGIAEESAPTQEASARQATETPPDAPLPASLAGEPPAPADLPTGPDEPEVGDPGPANPVRDAIASVLRIVSSVEEPSGSRRDSQPAGPPEPPPPGQKRAEPGAGREPPSGFESRPIGELTVNIGCREGALPADFGRDQLARMQAKGRSIVFDRDWPKMGYCWDAPGLCYNPLYFEEINLERYGYGPKYLRIAQPVISAGQFFVTVPILPYRMVAEPSRQCVYTLGHYRPGSAVPYQVQLPPLDLKAGAVEGGLIVGLIYLIP
jgi:hypothetical protein